jgi:hypothetical protein
MFPNSFHVVNEIRVYLNYQFVHYKSHTVCNGLNPVLPDTGPMTNNRNYDTAFFGRFNKLLRVKSLRKFLEITTN